MSKFIAHASLLSSAALIGGAAFAPMAYAGCGCPSDGNGLPITLPLVPEVPVATSGLGESSPATTNLSADPSWQVYEFQRSGVRYVQVNDRYGVVRAAVGRIDGAFWVLPIGRDADRVRVPGDAAFAGTGVTVFRSGELEIVRYRIGGKDAWAVRAPEAAK